MEVPKSNVVPMQPQTGGPSNTMLMLAAAEMHNLGRLGRPQPARADLQQQMAYNSDMNFMSRTGNMVNAKAFADAVKQMPESKNIEDRRGETKDDEISRWLEDDLRKAQTKR